MPWANVREWLLPGAAEEDDGFRQEMYSASYRGTRMLAAAEAAVAIGAFIVLPREAALGLLILSASTLGVTRLHAAYPYGRLVGGLSAAAASVISIRSTLAISAADYALGAATIIYLGAIIAVPLQPLHCLLIGAIVTAACWQGGHVLFTVMLAVAATLMGATIYAQRRLQYNSFMETMHFSADMREFQSRAMSAESSATMVRLTAALAHELSSPIGALTSGIDTLIAVCARQAESPKEAQQKLLGLQADLRVSLKDSLDRLRKIVNRIQRLTNLDEATMQPANLNELVRESVGLMKPQSPAGTRFQLDLHPLPDLVCKPQRLMAVLCCVLTNAIQALIGEGCITISTQQRDSMLEVKIEDNGRGIPAGQLAHIFDPGFEVSDGRVSTGNWSLFMSRQYIKEHGGAIRIQSLEGKGTTVCVTLPAGS